MFNFREFLNESLNRPYPFKELNRVNQAQVFYSFKTVDGRPGTVMFIYVGNGEWTLDFTVDGGTEITGKGDAFRIFATVLSIVEDFYNSRKGTGYLTTVSILSQNKENADGTWNTSRSDLYRAILKRSGFKFRETNDDDSSEFIIQSQR